MAASPVLAGLACGIAFIVVFSVLSHRMPAYFDIGSLECNEKEPVQMSVIESVRFNQTMMTAYDISKATWQAIPLDEKDLSNLSLIKETLIETSSRQAIISGTGTYRNVPPVEFISVLQQMPNQERIWLRYEQLQDETGTIRPGTYVGAWVVNSNVLYVIQAYCFAE